MLTSLFTGFRSASQRTHTPDALLEWKTWKDRYPKVAMMARDVLSIPAAGVSVEREFSIARAKTFWNRNYDAKTFEQIMLIVHARRQEDEDVHRMLDDPMLTKEENDFEEKERKLDIDRATVDGFISDEEEDRRAPTRKSRRASRRTQPFSPRGSVVPSRRQALEPLDSSANTGPAVEVRPRKHLSDLNIPGSTPAKRRRTQSHENETENIPWSPRSPDR